jgi:ClpP class serine protease
MIFDNILFADSQTLKQVFGDIHMKQQNPNSSVDYMKLSKEAHACSYYTELNGDVQLQDSPSVKKLSKEERVAVIPIHGMMQREFSYWYRCCSTEFVRYQINVANADPNILAIVLDVRSGGGTAAGTYELHEAIKKSDKPIITAYTDLGASAAVWAGSAGTEVYSTTPITMVGSVGAITTHAAVHRMYEEFGIDVKVLVSTGSDAKKVGTPYEPLKEEDEELIVSRLSKIRDVFLSSVRKSRASKEGVSFDEAAVKTANIYDAKVAAEIGLTDGIMTMEKVLSRAFTLGRKYNNDKKKKGTKTSKTQTNISMNDAGRLGNFVAKGKQVYTTEQTFSADFLNALADTMEGLEDSNTKLTETNASLTQKVADLEGKVSAVNNEVESLKTSKTDLEETVKNQDAQIKALEADLETKNAEIEAKNEEVAEAAAKFNEEDFVAKADYEALKAELDQAKADNEELEGKVTKLSSDVEELETNLNNTEAELTKTNAAYNELARRNGFRTTTRVVSSQKSQENKVEGEGEKKSKYILGQMGGLALHNA